jgi:hypothetical protein
MQRCYRTQYGKDPPSDNSTRRWLKPLQENGSVLHRKGGETSNTSQEIIDRIHEPWTSYVQKKVGMLKLFSILQYWLYK